QLLWPQHVVALVRAVAEGARAQQLQRDARANALHDADTGVAVSQGVRPGGLLALDKEAALPVMDEAPVRRLAAIHVHLRPMADRGEGRAQEHLARARIRNR